MIVILLRIEIRWLLQERAVRPLNHWKRPPLDHPSLKKIHDDNLLLITYRNLSELNLRLNSSLIESLLAEQGLRTNKGSWV